MAVELKVVSDSKQAKADLAQLRVSVDNIGKSVDNAVKGFKSFAISSGVIVGVGLVARQFLVLSDSITNINGKIRLVTNSQLEFNNAMSDTRKIAINTRTSLEDVTSLYQRIGAASEALGASQRDIGIVTQAVSKSMAISSATTSEAIGAITQLGQALNSGLLQGDELRSLRENAPALFRAIAKGMGKTTDEIRTLGAEGKLTSKAVFDAILSQAGDIDNAFNRVGVTFAAASTNIKNGGLLIAQALFKVFNGSGGAGGGSRVTVTDKINAIGIAMYRLAENMDVVILKLQAKFLFWQNDFMYGLEEMQRAFVGFFQGTFGALAKASGFSLPTLDVSKFLVKLEPMRVLVMGWVTTIERAFFWLYDRVIGHSWIPDLVTGVIDWISKLMDTPIKIVKTFVGVVNILFKNLAETSAFKSVAKVATGMFDSIINSGPFKKLASFWKDFVDSFNNSQIAHTLKQVFGMQDKYPYSYKGADGKTYGSDTEAQVGRGPHRSPTSRPIFHDVVNALPEGWQAPLIVGIGTVITGAILLAFKGSVVGQAIAAAFTTGVALVLTSTVSKDAINVFTGNLADTGLKIVAKLVDVLFGSGIFGERGFAGTLTLLAKLAIAFAAGRAALAKAAIGIATAPTNAVNSLSSIGEGAFAKNQLEKTTGRIAEVGSKLTESKEQMTKAVNALQAQANALNYRNSGIPSKDVAGILSGKNDGSTLTKQGADSLRAFNLASAEARNQTEKYNNILKEKNNLTGKEVLLKQQSEKLEKINSENKDKFKSGLTNFSAGIGGIFGTLAGFKIGEQIAEGMEGYSGWAKIGVVMATALTGQIVLAGVGQVIGLAIVAVLGKIGAVIGAGILAVIAGGLTAPILLLIAGLSAFLIAWLKPEWMAALNNVFWDFYGELNVFIIKISAAFEKLIAKIPGVSENADPKVIDQIAELESKNARLGIKKDQTPEVAAEIAANKAKMKELELTGKAGTGFSDLPKMLMKGTVGTFATIGGVFSQSLEAVTATVLETGHAFKEIGAGILTLDAKRVERSNDISIGTGAIDAYTKFANAMKRVWFDFIPDHASQPGTNTPRKELSPEKKGLQDELSKYLKEQNEQEKKLIEELKKVSSIGDLGGNFKQTGYTTNAFTDQVTASAKALNVDSVFANRVIDAESSGNPNAVSPTGAVGLGQLQAAAAEQFGLKVSESAKIWEQMRDELKAASKKAGNEISYAAAAAKLKASGFAFPDTATLRREGDQRLDPTVAIDASMKYLKQLLDMFDGSVEKAAAAYNYGAGRVKAILDANGGKLNYSKLPDDTKAYVSKVAGVATGLPKELVGYLAKTFPNSEKSREKKDVEKEGLEGFAEKIVRQLRDSNLPFASNIADAIEKGMKFIFTGDKKKEGEVGNARLTLKDELATAPSSEDLQRSLQSALKEFGHDLTDVQIKDIVSSGQLDNVVQAVDSLDTLKVAAVGAASFLERLSAGNKVPGAAKALSDAISPKVAEVSFDEKLDRSNLADNRDMVNSKLGAAVQISMKKWEEMTAEERYNINDYIKKINRLQADAEHFKNTNLGQRNKDLANKFIDVVKDLTKDADVAITSIFNKAKKLGADAIKAGATYASQFQADSAAGFRDVLLGKYGPKTFFRNIFDTFTAQVVDNFSKSFTNTLTKNLGIDDFLSKLMASVFQDAGDMARVFSPDKIDPKLGGGGIGDPQAKPGSDSVFTRIADWFLPKKAPINLGSKSEDYSPGDNTRSFTGSFAGKGEGSQPAKDSTISEGFSKLGSAFTDSTMSLGERFTSGFDGIAGVFKGGLEGLMNGLGGLFNGIFSLFGKGGGQALSWVKVGLQAISAFGGGGSTAGGGTAGPMVWEGGGYATGGIVDGAGTSISDSIPAMLSKGEFVVNAQATRKYANVLQRINAGQMKHFATGGMVPDVMPATDMAGGSHAVKGATAKKVSQQQVFNINITGDVSRQTRSEIQKMIPNIATGVNKHNYENNIR